MSNLTLPTGNMNFSNSLSYAFVKSMLKISFPFTLSQIKKKEISDEALLEYELSALKLAKKLDETIKLLAIKEKKQPDLDFQLKILHKIKKSI